MTTVLRRVQARTDRSRFIAASTILLLLTFGFYLVSGEELDLDLAFDAIDEILASRAWESGSNRPTVVT